MSHWSPPSVDIGPSLVQHVSQNMKATIFLLALAELLAVSIQDDSIVLKSLEDLDDGTSSSKEKPPSAQSLESASSALRALLKGENSSINVTKKTHLRKDWCKSEPLLQEITQTGCRTKMLKNRFCYGQCNSFFIPGNGKPALPFKSCAVCRPRRASWVTVTLTCPKLHPPLRRRRVLKVKQCECLAPNSSY